VRVKLCEWCFGSDPHATTVLHGMKARATHPALGVVHLAHNAGLILILGQTRVRLLAQF